jgi:hypothetical protein
MVQIRSRKLTSLRYTRWAKPLSIPTDIAKILPELFLDGELWYVNTIMEMRIRKLIVGSRFGRGNFNEANKLSMGANDDTEWADLRFLIFDQPIKTDGPSSNVDLGVASILGNLKYEGRYDNLVQGIPATHPTVVLVPQLACESLGHIYLLLFSL